ncbi:MAG: ABC transporter substrate-binding protein, partial [Acidimicrobiales bacterium]
MSRADHPLIRRPRRCLALCLAVALTAAACSSSDNAPPDPGTASGPQVGDTFTIALGGPPTLDPYKANPDPTSTFPLNLTYAALIHRNADGTYGGDLAESFAYTDDENKAFVIKIRPNLQFADGTPIDADAVVASLAYFRQVGLNSRTWGGSIDTITATDPLTIQVTNKVPNPDMPFIFSQASLAGSIISPAGLADPSKLGQATFGAGPYVLDTSQSVANDHYVFTPNPNYRDPSARHWQKVVIRVITDPTAAVQSVQAGQVDFSGAPSNLIPAIEAAGLPYSQGPAAIIGVALADRDGTVASPLADQRGATGPELR